MRLSGGQGLLQVVDLKPIPLDHGHRVHGLNLPEAAVGVGPLGAFGGYVLMPVMNERGLFWNIAPSGLTRWALLPGNARETWGRDLVVDLPAVLGDRGFRWVQGVKTPPYRVRGGKEVETGWKGWVTRKRTLLGKVRNWIETRFSVMVRSLGLHRIAAFPSGKHLVARSYLGLLARVNLILLVHNLYEVAHEGISHYPREERICPTRSLATELLVAKTKWLASWPRPSTTSPPYLKPPTKPWLWVSP
jgi:hypothetical protein